MIINLVSFDEVRTITANEYFKNNAYVVEVFNKKYALTKADGSLETPAEVFWRVAYNISLMEEDQTQAEYFANTWFSLMWGGWYRPGGSILSGVGSGRKSSTSNCTTLPIAEDTLESIAKCEYETMKCAAYRQGIGVDFSRLRPRGSKVGNAAMESTGVIPWMDKISRIGNYVGQAGRVPALLESLIINHPDILEFIVCKDDLMYINNSNISVQIINEFMAKLDEADADWELRFEVKESGEVISKVLKAKHLFRLIAEHAHKTAEPGVQFRNLLQDSIMYKAVADVLGDDRFMPHSSNACSEKFMAPYSVCNLASVNMEMFSIEDSLYKKEIEAIVPYVVRMSDNVITYELEKELSPLPKQKWIVTQLREIGLGITNIHGWLLKQGLAYDSDEGIEKAEEFMKCYAHAVFKASVLLGEERGSAPAWDLVKDKTKFMATTYFRNIINEFFNGDATCIKTMRNMAHLSIAPTGSLSSTFPSPCISSGVEPVMGLYYWRKTRVAGNNIYQYYFTIPNRLLEYILTKIDKTHEDYTILSGFSGAELDDDGAIGKRLIPIIHKYIPKDFIKPAHEIDPMQKIKLLGRLYKWIDASISCTFNLREDVSIDVVETIYKEAYNHGVRAVSIYRDNCRPGIYIFEDPITNRNKYDNKKVDKKRPETIVPVYAPKRPKELLCNIHHCSVKGTPWLVLVGMFNNVPYEVFAGEAEDLYLPKSCKVGTIVKCSDGTYSLVVTIRKSEVEYKNLAYLLMDTEQRALTRLLSLSIRHGCPLEFIQKQLRKANGDITNFSTVVARVLGSYVKSVEIVGEAARCPSCGNYTMVMEEGCTKCSDPECGFARCE